MAYDRREDVFADLILLGQRGAIRVGLRDMPGTTRKSSSGIHRNIDFLV